MQKPESPPEWMRPLLADLEAMLRALWVPEPPPRRVTARPILRDKHDSLCGFARLGAGHFLIYVRAGCIRVKVWTLLECRAWKATLDDDMGVVRVTMVKSAPGGGPFREVVPPPALAVRFVREPPVPGDPAPTLAEVLRAPIQKAVSRAIGSWPPGIVAWLAGVAPAIQAALPAPIADEVIAALRPGDHVTAWDDLVGEAGPYVGSGFPPGDRLRQRAQPQALPQTMWDALAPWTSMWVPVVRRRAAPRPLNEPPADEP